MLSKVALRELRYHPWQTVILVLLIALAVAASVFVTTLGGGLQRGLVQATEPFPQIVGAKGSAYQLVLNTVFLQDRPIGNMKPQVLADLKANPDVKMAVPLAFGDNLRGFRIVGTTPEIFKIKPKADGPEWMHLAQGRAFDKPFEAVLGADTAKRLNMGLGDKFYSIHGATVHGHVHKDQQYTVVGILAPVGGPYDQSVLTDIRSVWLAHAHHHHHDEGTPGSAEAGHHHTHGRDLGGAEPDAIGAALDAFGHGHTHANAGQHGAAAAGHVHEHAADGHVHEHEDSAIVHAHDGAGHAVGAGDGHAHEEDHDGEHAAKNGEVTAILLQPSGYAQAMRLAMQFQRSPEAQLLFPAQVIISLFSMMGQGETMWAYIGGFLILVALFLVLLTGYLTGLQHLHERAVLRVLGATRRDFIYLTLIQNIAVIGCGGVLGYLLGTGFYALVGHVLAGKTAIDLPILFMPIPFYIALATVIIGILLSLIPAYLLQKKDTLSYL